jgi:hypothetical protein
MRAMEREDQAAGAQGPEPLILLPAYFNSGKRTTAGAAAQKAVFVSVLGVVEKYSMEFRLLAAGEGHRYPPVCRVSGGFEMRARTEGVGRIAAF